MTPRERRHYDAILCISQTLTALQRYHEYYISQDLARQINALRVSLNNELARLEADADAAEKARGA